MAKDDPYSLATMKGEKVAKDHKYETLPVDPFAIAKTMQIEVMAKPPQSVGVSGMLMRLGEVYGIAYATNLDNIGFQRFSVAHELGHFYLSGHLDAVLAHGDVHESKAGFRSVEKYEREADHFAAGLLMPRYLVSPALRRFPEGLNAIEKLRDLCGTSTTATAIRYTQCTRDPVAIIVSTGNKIDYCFMSSKLEEWDGLNWIKKGQAISQHTPTYTFNQDTSNVQLARKVTEASNLQEWLGGNREIKIREEVLGLGQYGKTLTVLSDIDSPDEDDDSVSESWTPGFK